MMLERSLKLATKTEQLTVLESGAVLVLERFLKLATKTKQLTVLESGAVLVH